MQMSRLSRIGVLGVVRLLSRGKDTSLCRSGFAQGLCRQYWKPQFELHPEIKAFRSNIFQRHQYSTSAAGGDSATDGDDGTEKISVTFVDKDGEEKHIKVPVGMSMLEAAHENDIELEGACEGSLACSTCHVIVMDMEYYNKLEDPTDEENDMLDLAFGLTETSRLGCQVIASPELDGIRLALPAATRNFAVDGYVPKPH
ncbi:Adrenodoxin-like protein 2, mitochondrial [Turnera subulata]|uniref:Adrenodoxin-like protein 2, mitochondrial n=1 Tax=Turnera subulata TaxID=218843 RepID=A0A9Q0JBS4_9ROSI|nr:Adrenodoxin-like protein 2, mitochondrial [Turnera subulata]